MKVLITCIDGRKYSLDAAPQDTVGSLKESIHKHGGPEPSRQRLIFCGKVHADNTTLEQCGFQEGSAFHLVIDSEEGKRQEAERKEEAEKQKQEMKRLNENIRELQEKLELLAAEQKQELAEQVSMVEEKNRALEIEKRDLAQRIQHLQQKQEKAQEIAKMVSEAQAEVQREAGAKVRALETALEQERSRHKAHAQKQIKDLETVQQQKFEAEKQAQEARRKIKRLEAQIETQEQTQTQVHEEAQAALSKCQEELSRCKGRLLASQTHLKDTVALHEEEKRKVQDQERALAAVQAERIALSRCVAETRDKLNSQRHTHEAELLKANERVAKAVDALGEREVVHSARCAELYAELQQTVDRLFASQKDLADCRKALDAAESAAHRAGDHPAQVANAQMDTELAQVMQAISKYNEAQSASRVRFEERAASAEVRATEAENNAQAATSNLRAQVEALKKENSSLHTKLNDVYSGLGQLLDSPAQGDAKKTAPVKSKATAKAKAKAKARVKVKAKAVPSKNLKGVGCDLQFLIGGREVVRVVAEEPTCWRLASGRVAKKRTEGRSWVWCTEEPRSFGVGCFIQYRHDPTVVREVVADGAHEWKLEGGCTVDKILENLHWEWFR